MRLRSRGLGRKELVMDFREYEVVREQGELVVVGTIRDPVNWDFTIRVCEDDIPGLLRLVLRPAMIGMLLRSLFKRNRRHHWSGAHPEHLTEGRRRLAVAREKALERAHASLESQTPQRRGARGAPVARPAMREVAQLGSEVPATVADAR